jgi:cAMP phosphodiesterase
MKGGRSYIHTLIQCCLPKAPNENSIYVHLSSLSWLLSESQQQHGMGQIMNYMFMDMQQMSNVMFHMHTLWMIYYKWEW